jgi:hypothetical protein
MGEAQEGKAGGIHVFACRLKEVQVFQKNHKTIE